MGRLVTNRTGLGDLAAQPVSYETSYDSFDSFDSFDDSFDDSFYPRSEPLIHVEFAELKFGIITYKCFA